MELARLLPHRCRADDASLARPSGDEVDIVPEDRRGRLVAIEIKAGATVGRNDLRAMNKLRALAAERFVAGLVLCTTRQTTPLGDRLWTVPIEALWTGHDSA